MSIHFPTSCYNCFKLSLYLMRSCVSPSLNVQLFAHPVIPYLKMISNIFSLSLCTKLGFPHPIACDFFQCIWQSANRFNEDTPISLCSWGRVRCPHMMQFKIISPPLLGMSSSVFCTNRHMFSRCHVSSHHNDKWILCL